MKAFLKSFHYAFNGIIESWKQRNMKIHVICAILTLMTAFYFSISKTEWMIILLCIGFVFSMEITNTALEIFVDLVHPHQHEKAGKIKDLAAGAVLVSAIFSLLIGCIIFYPYVIGLFR